MTVFCGLEIKTLATTDSFLYVLEQTHRVLLFALSLIDLLNTVCWMYTLQQNLIFAPCIFTIPLLFQLKVGQQYEVVVTTVNGIYRLRFGDIIEVVGHFNSVPKYILKGRSVPVTVYNL